ncbi:MAG: CrcB family protein [Cryobacterium sp.]|nr:CrcB family protein [Cryobacterium sp.]MBX3310679.1 CrcB family protein [Cryobacterium sp.]MCB1280261.1 CrcB family protein [Salinibacterium sp.]
MSVVAVVVALAAGGAAAAIRYGLSVLLAGPSRAEEFPWTVLLVNAVGSGIGGAMLGLAHAGGASADLQLIILTGVCGGLTTFSTFSVETIQLITHGRWRSAVVSVGANLVAGFGACILGYVLVPGALG